MDLHSVGAADLKGEVVQLLKDIRRSRNAQQVPFQVQYGGGAGLLRLDSLGSRRFTRLVEKLQDRSYFEHRDRQQLRNRLVDQLGPYQDQRSSVNPERLLLDLAQAPMEGTVYFGIAHVTLPADADLGFARLLRPSQVTFLRRPALPAPFDSCDAFCAVSAAGGTAERLRQRGERIAETAVSLLRDHLHRNLPGIHPDQLQFALNGFWWFVREGESAPTIEGGARRRAPVRLDLAASHALNFTALETRGRRLDGIRPSLRWQVYSALWWLSAAATATSWRLSITAIFTALETVLVPENCGRKAEVVTVRATALLAHVVGAFQHPFETYEAYIKRSNVVHGTSLVEADEADEAREVTLRRLLELLRLPGSALPAVLAQVRAWEPLSCYPPLWAVHEAAWDRLPWLRPGPSHARPLPSPSHNE